MPYRVIIRLASSNMNQSRSRLPEKGSNGREAYESPRIESCWSPPPGRTRNDPPERTSSCRSQMASAVFPLCRPVFLFSWIWRSAEPLSVEWHSGLFFGSGWPQDIELLTQDCRCRKTDRFFLWAINRHYIIRDRMDIHSGI